MAPIEHAKLGGRVLDRAVRVLNDDMIQATAVPVPPAELCKCFHTLQAKLGRSIASEGFTIRLAASDSFNAILPVFGTSAGQRAFAVSHIPNPCPVQRGDSIAPPRTFAHDCHVDTR